MRKYMLCTMAVVFSIVITSSHVLAQRKKIAQTGFQFLSVGTVGRAAAMGEALTTIEGSSSALFYNPAGMARLSSFIDLSINYSSWISDITYNSFSIALSPRHGDYGVFGISAMWVDYGEFLGTMRWSNAKGYVDTEVFTPTAIAVGIGYAKYLTDKFAVGGQIKQVAQYLGESVIPDKSSNTGLAVSKNVASVLAFDFGTIFRTGYKSLAFGMNVRNFSEELKFEQESFQLPLTFKVGISMDILDFINNISDAHSFLVAIDAVHPRSYPEYINCGGEYLFMNTFALRAGYMSNRDEYGLTYGFGIRKFGLAFDYAYTPFGVFDGVQRVTIRMSI
ncbi:MAG: PorV/PorQ family protein [Candidatus Marinimicrobia bacterium]|nr:PorV/PorQ family protein [Candidatus Neomarinimicrobiota bacterium]